MYSLIDSSENKIVLPDENNFTFTCKDNSGKIILGHSNINTNRINIM